MRPETAESVFAEMSDFAKYAFNKSHAAAYAVVAFRTAYLKCHHRREYMCALLNSVAGDNRRVDLYIDDLSRAGIRVLPPDVNESGEGFTVVGDNLRFGLAAVKNVGGAFAAFIVQERLANGPYTGFEDFLLRTQGRGNVRMIESLVNCGAMDGFGHPRSRMAAAAESAVQTVAGMNNGVIAGQMGLFDAVGGTDELFRIDYPDRISGDAKAGVREGAGRRLPLRPSAGRVPQRAAARRRRLYADVGRAPVRRRMERKADRHRRRHPQIPPAENHEEK